MQLCGDAHLSNFGVFASPDRRLVFDLNDFDETLPGPWEWDVKRLAVSMEVAGRDNGYSDKERRAILLETVAGYRNAMREFAGMGALDVWYSRLEVDELFAQLRSQTKKAQLKRVEKTVAKARTKDSMTAFSKLTRMVDGEPQIVADPPLIERVEDIAGDMDPEAVAAGLHELIRLYRQSLQTDRRILLEEFRLVDLARKVVGVGSVGTRAWIALMIGRDESDPLFLQFKEAQSSVLEEFTAKSGYANHGERVVAGQHLMQASSDIFLGWLHVEAGIDGVSRDFYGRQLKDWKGSFETRGGAAPGHGDLRPNLRVDACPRPRPLRRSDRDRLLPRRRRRLRPRHRRLLGGIRRPERAGLQGSEKGGRRRQDRRSVRPVTSA